MQRSSFADVQDASAALTVILQLVGAGHYLRLATVNRQVAAAAAVDRQAHARPKVTVLDCSSLALVQWAHETGLQWTDHTATAIAARCSDPAVLRYAYEHGCPVSQWRTALCTGAAGAGHLDVLRYAHKQLKCVLSVEAACQAAAGGHHAVLRYLHIAERADDKLLTGKAGISAARNGRLSTLLLLEGMGVQISYCCMPAAAGGGHLAVVQHLQKTRRFSARRSAWDSTVHDSIAAAESGGHVHVVCYLMQLYAAHDREEVQCEAVQANDVQRLRQLTENCGWQLPSYLLQTAVHAKSHEALRYLLSRGCAEKWPDARTNLEQTVIEGDTETVALCLRHGCPVDYQYLLSVAAQHNRCALLQLLAQHSAAEPPAASVLHAAVRGRHPQAVQLLVEQLGVQPAHDALCVAVQACAGCSSSSEQLAHALQVLHYLRVHGATCSAATTTECLTSDTLPALRYCVQHGCPLPTNATALARSVEVLQYLRAAAGVQWHATTTYAAARRGCLPLLLHAVQHGCSWHADTDLAAVEADSTEVLDYVRQHCSVRRSDEALLLAACAAGATAVVRSAWRQNWPAVDWTLQPLLHAAAADNGHVVDLLLREGCCSLSEQAAEAACLLPTGALTALRCLMQRCCPTGARTATAAASQPGNLDVLRHLHNHSCSVDREAVQHLLYLHRDSAMLCFFHSHM